MLGVRVGKFGRTMIWSQFVGKMIVKTHETQLKIVGQGCNSEWFQLFVSSQYCPIGGEIVCRDVMHSGGCQPKAKKK